MGTGTRTILDEWRSEIAYAQKMARIYLIACDEIIAEIELAQLLDMPPTIQQRYRKALESRRKAVEGLQRITGINAESAMEARTIRPLLVNANSDLRLIEHDLFPYRPIRDPPDLRVALMSPTPAPSAGGAPLVRAAERNRSRTWIGAIVFVLLVWIGGRWVVTGLSGLAVNTPNRDAALDRYANHLYNITENEPGEIDWQLLTDSEAAPSERLSGAGPTTVTLRAIQSRLRALAVPKGHGWTQRQMLLSVADELVAVDLERRSILANGRQTSAALESRAYALWNQGDAIEQQAENSRLMAGSDGDDDSDDQL